MLQHVSRVGGSGQWWLTGTHFHNCLRRFSVVLQSWHRRPPDDFCVRSRRPHQLHAFVDRTGTPRDLFALDEAGGVFESAALFFAARGGVSRRDAGLLCPVVSATRLFAALGTAQSWQTGRTCGRDLCGMVIGDEEPIGRAGDQRAVAAAI